MIRAALTYSLDAKEVLLVLLVKKNFYFKYKDIL